MATMTWRGQTYTIKFVDPGASGTNDGSSETNALTAMPSVASITVANIAYIVRRTVTELTWTVGSSSVNNILIMGCPLTTDMLADLVPGSTMSAWGADAPTQAILLASSATAGFVFTGTNVVVSRCELRSPTGAGTNSVGLLQLSTGAECGVMDSIIKVKSADITDGTRSTLVRRGLQLSGANCFVVNSEIHGSNDIPWDNQVSTRSSPNMKVLNNTFKWWDTSTPFALGSVSNLAFGLLVDTCKFWKRNTTATNGFALTLAADTNNVDTCTFLSDTDISGGTGVVGGASQFATFKNCTWTFQIPATGSITLADTFAGATFVGCTMTVTESATPTSGTVRGIGSGISQVYLKDSSFNIGGFNAIIFDSSNNIQHRENCTFSKGRIDAFGKIKIASLDLSSLAASSSTFGIIAEKMAQIYVQTLTVAGSGRYVQMKDDSCIFVDSVPFALNLDFNTTEERSCFYCLNEAGITGNFHAESLRNKVTTSSTYRTGSAVTWSYKCEGKTAAATTVPLLYIAPRPYAGIPITNTTTGRKSVTMYIAYKNYTITLDDLVLELEVPAAASGVATMTVSSQTNGYIATDASTWNNDSGLTIVKVVVIFNCLRAENITARIAYNKYTASAYVNIDPTLVIAAA